METITTLMYDLKKVDFLVDKIFVEYLDAEQKFGNESEIVKYFHEKYEKANKKKQKLKAMIAEAEDKQRLLKSVNAFLDNPNIPIGDYPVRQTRTKRIRDLLEDDDTEMESFSATKVSDDGYKPRKKHLTSQFGINYRKSPHFRQKQRDAVKERKTLKEFIVDDE